jgi:exopolysaccharide production protein ExoZ
MSAAQKFFPGVQALRAVAATLVVIEHAAFVSNSYSSLPIFPHFRAPPGRIGVVLFFAISGFVIALQRNKPVRQFVAHRLLRIYPSYWSATALAALLLWTVGRAIDFPSLASLLLYPSKFGDDTFAIPYWTLVFEMTFYALASFAFAVRLSDLTLTVIAVLWIVAANCFAGPEYNLPGFPDILWSSAVQVFPMGMICGIHFERLRRARRWPYAIAAAGAFAISSAYFAELTPAKTLTLGIMSCCLILAVADLNIRFRVVALLGNASYGIYLLHLPAMIAVTTILPIGFLGLLGIGLISGTVFGVFDYRFYNLLTKLVRRHDDPVGAVRL